MNDTSTPFRRLVAASGIGFALLFFFGVTTLNVPRSATNRELVAWWTDESHRNASIVSMYLFIFAGLLALVLISYLRTRLATERPETAMLGRLMSSSGLLFVVLLTASAASRGLIASAIAFNHEKLPGVDTLRFIPQFSYPFINAGLLAAAVMIAAMSTLVLRGSAFPRWLGLLGLVLAALVALVTLAFGRPFAIPLLCIWSLTTSIAVWRDTGQMRVDRRRSAPTVIRPDASAR